MTRIIHLAIGETWEDWPGLEPGWYFFDESETPCGPYDTREEAQVALDAYWEDLI